MPVLWTFRCYVSPRGDDEIDLWYQRLSKRAQAKFRTRLRFLAQQPRSGWKREPFDLLGNDCQGLGEIRFQADNVQHRAIGYFSRGFVFTIVFCAEEKNGRFVPRTTCQIAQKRRKEIEKNAERVRLCGFPLE
jgi:hypothetical protein